ncbi:MAG TPA: tRNA uridine-5-carboxymethylaminomethyl(34) synthesis GTPase MnmE [Firmicutes bacterium]|nr:tRNA uridine-5-carboxymethylaminomethyl(34) synthesis GTPase MnmE [Bacillota bacterium]
MMEETIAAISTPIGEGGIGIIRISGNRAGEIARRLFRRFDGMPVDRLQPRKVLYGIIVDPQTGERLDEVLLWFMPGPKSYTRQDIVEISCHGGIVSLRAVLEAVLKCGARLAEPGEFTRLAFMNGRIDLAQAEAVIDIIRARTEASRRVAMAQLSGGLSREVDMIRRDAVGILAAIEASIDFPDDVGEQEPERMDDTIRGLTDRINKLLSTADSGRIYREGISVVIVGRPNVGKSSLLNALARKARAIVTDIPGTTRDIIEEFVDIRQIPVRLVDTAGLRESRDLVERLGVERARNELETADLALVVLDISEGVKDEDRQVIDEMRPGKPWILVLNKSDLEHKISEEEARVLAPGVPSVMVSANEGIGLDNLEDAIADTVLRGKVSPRESCVVTNVRHKGALERSLQALVDARASLRAGVPLDLVAIDIREAIEALGEITGETAGEDVIDRIFADFCIGK